MHFQGGEAFDDLLLAEKVGDYAVLLPAARTVSNRQE